MRYIPLDPKFLSNAGGCDFSIYIYNPQHERFVLFKKEDAAIEREQLKTLTKNGQRPVFIPSEQAHQLNHYLSQNLQSIIDDRNMPLEEKSERFHALAETVMRGLFENPPDMPMFVSTARNVSDSLSQLLVSGPAVISKLNDLRSYDYHTYSHSLNVTALSVALFMEMTPDHAFDTLADLTRGVLLHDIGKCDVPPEVVNKPGKLTEEEWVLMRNHTVNGYKRLEADEDLSPDSRIISLLHHESVNGKGYPGGLGIDKIPFTSRICKVCDVYDALTSRRVYKKGMKAFEALQLMTSEMRGEFDPDILRAFIVLLDKMGKTRF